MNGGDGRFADDDIDPTGVLILVMLSLVSAFENGNIVLTLWLQMYKKCRDLSRGDGGVKEAKFTSSDRETSNPQSTTRASLV